MLLLLLLLLLLLNSCHHATSNTTLPRFRLQAERQALNQTMGQLTTKAHEYDNEPDITPRLQLFGKPREAELPHVRANATHQFTIVQPLQQQVRGGWRK